MAAWDIENCQFIKIIKYTLNQIIIQPQIKQIFFIKSAKKHVHLKKYFLLIY